MTNIRTHGFDTEAQLQEHLAEMEAETTGEADLAVRPVDLAQMREERTLAKLRSDIETLRRQVALVKEETAMLAKSSVQRVDDNAHRQLGDYPWLKLAGAMAASFLAGRLLRKLPFGSLATVALPLVTARLADRSR